MERIVAQQPAADLGQGVGAERLLAEDAHLGLDARELPEAISWISSAERSSDGAPDELRVAGGPPGTFAMPARASSSTAPSAAEMRSAARRRARRHRERAGRRRPATRSSSRCTRRSTSPPRDPRDRPPGARRIQAEMRVLGKQALGTDSLPESPPAAGRQVAHVQDARRDRGSARATLARSATAPSSLPRPSAEAALRRQAHRLVREKDSPAAYYRPASLDGSRPGAYYVDTFERRRGRARRRRRWPSTSRSPATTSRSRSAGAHGPARVRKHLGVTAFVEGWGPLRPRGSPMSWPVFGPLERLGRLSFSAWRAIRLVVDTGIHAKGWTRAPRHRLHGGETPPSRARTSSTRSTATSLAGPGPRVQARRARDSPAARPCAGGGSARASTCARSHDALLGAGAVSLPVLREQIDALDRECLLGRASANDPRSAP